MAWLPKEKVVQLLPRDAQFFRAITSPTRKQGTQLWLQRHTPRWRVGLVFGHSEKLINPVFLPRWSEAA